MIAARLNETGQQLHLAEISEPLLIPSSVKIKVLASHLMSYTGEVFEGRPGRIQPPVPYTPGPSAIGIVEAVADDVYGLKTGQMVFCQPWHGSSLNRERDESILIGWFGLTQGCGHLLSRWKNGSFAEKAIYPVDCVTPILDEEVRPPVKLAILNILTVAYGALLKGNMTTGQTILVNGATGNIGAAVVVLSLLMGANKVIAAGRDTAILSELSVLDKRVIPYQLKEDSEQEPPSALSSEINIMVDASAAPNYASTKVCLNALANKGVAVFVGGVRNDIPIPYMDIVRKELTIKGSFMYSKDVPAAILKLIGSGRLDLNIFREHIFPLEQINSAISLAPQFKGLNYAVIVP